jgi:hypothetical protein
MITRKPMKGLISSHGTLLLKLMKRYITGTGYSSKGSFLHSLYLYCLLSYAGGAIFYYIYLVLSTLFNLV